MAHTWKTIRDHQRADGRLIVERCGKCDSGRVRFVTQSRSETIEEYASRSARDCEEVGGQGERAGQ